MRKFQTRVCPLCSKALKKKELKLNDVVQNTDYHCEEFYLGKSPLYYTDLLDLIEADHTGAYSHVPHYSVKNVSGNYLQITIVPPFYLETGETDSLTKVYKFPFMYDKHRGNKKELMLEIPAIYPEDYLPGRLVEKLKTLILFS